LDLLNLPHVAARVFGTPLMIGRAKLEVILGVLGRRFAGGSAETAPATSEPPMLAAVTPEGIAIIPIIGTLVSRSGFVDAASGLLAYADIGDTIAGAMADPTVHGIILDMDSPGGEVGGLFDLVDRIGALKMESGKPLWAVANEGALSAAYAIASATDRIYVTRTGEVGSIGVVAAHVDESGADAKAGLAWSFVFAGNRKVDGNSHGALSERARADIQADVDRLYADFCALVAGNRGLTPVAVRATEAAIFRGDLAVRAGLADRIGTLDMALADMTAEFERPLVARHSSIKPTPKRSPSMATEDTEQIETAPPEPAVALLVPGPAVASAPPVPPAPETNHRPDPAETLRAEYAEIAAISAQANRLGVTIDAADAMRKGIRPDALRRSVLDALASRSEASSVIATAPLPQGASESPIVRRARERAGQSQK
jgi:signal peptide peptidase SppA